MDNLNTHSMILSRNSSPNFRHFKTILYSHGGGKIKENHKYYNNSAEAKGIKTNLLRGRRIFSDRRNRPISLHA